MNSTTSSIPRIFRKRFKTLPYGMDGDTSPRS